jgi:hypothetical protein
MALIVETGTASSTSEAYASVAFTDAYHEKIGNTLWAALSTVEKEQALRRATMFMGQFYRLQWKGLRVSSTQALDWPRYSVQLPDLDVYNVVVPDVVPLLVQNANAELALLAIAGPLNPNLTQGVESVQVGPIKKVYDKSSPQGVRYTAISDILRPLLESSNGMSVKLRRV